MRIPDALFNALDPMVMDVLTSPWFSISGPGATWHYDQWQKHRVLPRSRPIEESIVRVCQDLRMSVDETDWSLRCILV